MGKARQILRSTAARSTQSSLAAGSKTTPTLIPNRKEERHKEGAAGQGRQSTNDGGSTESTRESKAKTLPELMPAPEARARSRISLEHQI